MQSTPAPIRPQLTLADLATALRTYTSYNAIDVFADDVREVVEARDSGAAPPAMLPLDSSGEHFAVTIDGEPFRLFVDRRQGAARLSRPVQAIVPVQQGPEGTLVAAAIGGVTGAAILAAMTKKGEGWLPGLALGLLVGAAIGQAATTPNAPQTQPRKVFTLKFNPETKQWDVYDGGLVGWMKQELLASGS